MSGEKVEYTTAVAPAGQGNILMPALTIVEATQRYKRMAELVKTIMKDGVDYGTIQGTAKPTLYKPGAEKLTTFFGLRVVFVLRDKLENWDGGRFHYTYACQLWRDNTLITESEGSANSMEKRYRWRNISEKKASEADKARAVRIEQRSGRYGDYRVYVVENDDPYTLVNTLQKMAQKRALVGSTLIAVNASEFFTQDMEDIIDGDYSVVEQPETLPEKPEDVRAIAYEQEPPEASTPTTRPALPETVKGWLVAKSTKYGGQEKPSANAIGLMAGKLNEAHKDHDQARHLFTDYVFGKASSKDMVSSQVRAVLDWLIVGKDTDTGDYTLDSTAVKEYARIVRKARLDAGQTELEMIAEKDTADLFGKE